MSPSELAALLQPENELEATFLEDPEFQRGLLWGVPRYGHPEGAIWRHILEVNANIDRLPISANWRRQLRIISWVHDTFKHLEDRSSPRDWTKHHGVFARKFLANYLQDEQLLALVELHDEAYYIWRLQSVQRPNHETATRRLQLLRAAVRNDYWQLYYLFYKCDTVTGDKNQAPMKWFEATMEDIEIVPFTDQKTFP